MIYPIWSSERARTRAALGFEPSDSDFVFSLFSRLSFLALGSTRNSSCLSGSVSTAASLGGSPSSSLNSSSSCCGLCGIGTSSCRDNRQKTVAPRRQGSWVPSPCTLGSLGPLPSCALMPPTLFRELLFSVAVGPPSLWFASPGVLSQPPASLGRFWGRRPFVRSTIAPWQEATDPQSPEGGSQRACTHGGCPPHGFRATSFSSQDAASSGCQPRVVPILEWSVLKSPPFSTRTVALLTQSYPAILEVTLLQRGCN